MTATYTWDVFSTVDAYGSYGEDGDWGGYWGKQGPELLDHRAALFADQVRMVFGATTFRENAEILTSGLDPNSFDEWNVRTIKRRVCRPSARARVACAHAIIGLRRPIEHPTHCRTRSAERRGASRRQARHTGASACSPAGDAGRPARAAVRRADWSTVRVEERSSRAGA
ncbi:MAG: hypothetical protein JWN62_1132, partial [Acidimicrobiales bacterium]|nr:hypothetical protein [Acidimicrobiales bacterium]